MNKLRLLASCLAGVAACAAGLTLLWLDFFVWQRGETRILEIGGALAFLGAGWAINRAMVAFGQLSEEPAPSAAKAPPHQDEPQQPAP
jgi:hypothetical protein